MNKSILTVGEGLGVLRTHESLVQAGYLEAGVGGAELNVAIGLARLGCAVRWLGRVGPDSLGRRIVRELRAEGVEVVAPVDDSPTGLLLKERDTLGRTVVTYHRTGSAGSHLSPEDLDCVDWRACGVLHVTGITPSLSDSAHATVMTAIDRATDAGSLVSFDVNHRARLWSANRAGPALRSIAARADIVFAGLDEASMLLEFQHDDPTDVATALLGLGPRQAVVKLGDRGAVAVTNDERLRLAARRVEVVDTVGAGDAFVAGFLAELIEDQPLPVRLATAVAAGAAACRHSGDWEGAVTRHDLHTDGGDPVVR